MRCDALMPLEIWSFAAPRSCAASSPWSSCPAGERQVPALVPPGGGRDLLSLELRARSTSRAGPQRHRRRLPARRGHRRAARRGGRLGPGGDLAPPHPPSRGGMAVDLLVLLDRRPRRRPAVSGEARPLLPRPLRQPHRAPGAGDGAARGGGPEKIEGSPESFYSFVVDGEVLYKGELFEHFRYRFTLPRARSPAPRSRWSSSATCARGSTR